MASMFVEEISENVVHNTPLPVCQKNFFYPKSGQASRFSYQFTGNTQKSTEERVKPQGCNQQNTICKTLYRTNWFLASKQERRRWKRTEV